MIFQKIQLSRGVRPFFAKNDTNHELYTIFHIFLSKPSRTVRPFGSKFDPKKSPITSYTQNCNFFEPKKDHPSGAVRPVLAEILVIFSQKFPRTACIFYFTFFQTFPIQYITSCTSIFGRFLTILGLKNASITRCTPFLTKIEKNNFQLDRAVHPFFADFWPKNQTITSCTPDFMKNTQKR